MNNKLICFVFLVVGFVCSNCGKPLAPKYLGYDNFRVQKVGLQNNLLATNIKLYNPNRYPLQLKSASIDVYFNNNFLGHSSLDTLIILPAKDTSYVPLTLQAKAKDVLSNALKVFFNPDVKVKITGSAKAGRSGFFVNVPIDYEGTQRIELSDFK
jgi:LEA14-like dessication related protein